jgi:hypothetical protein
MDNKSTMKTLQILMLGMLASVMLLGTVSASGVVSSYWLPDRPLQLNPGESKNIQFTFENSGADSDVTIRARIENGSDLAVITDQNMDYAVPINGSASINVRVTAPSTASGGYTRQIEISFTPVNTGTKNGQLGINTAFGKQFNLVVVTPTPQEPSKENNVLPVWLVFAILIVAVIIFIIIKRRPRKKVK